MSKWEQTADRALTPEHLRAKMRRVIYELAAHHRPTAEHSVRVGILGAQICEYVGEDPWGSLSGGTLHDWGKVKVPRELLNKTTTWTEADARALRAHPLDGYHKVSEMGMPVTACIVVRHHTFQPNGYPENPPELPPGLQEHLGDFVLRHSRHVALADFYDAAHRNDSGVQLNGEEIREKVRARNPDDVTLVDGLYEANIFSVA